ncbi:MAG: 2OG-Fe(II) oxygenase [Litorimonas sp.]
MNAQPWPHAVFDDFLPKRVAERTLDAFPNPDHSVWRDWRKKGATQYKKQGIGNVARPLRIDPFLEHVMGAFQSSAFLKFLEALTGIEKLLPDPHMHGGGLHQILPGGHLDMHTDFNLLNQLDLYRRLNVLLYLNRNWKPDYDGALEMWDPDELRCVRTVEPLFNRLVVFITDKRSLHGHPKPLKTPEGMTRKSLAFYYYTARPASETLYDTRTDWHITDREGG